MQRQTSFNGPRTISLFRTHAIFPKSPSIIISAASAPNLEGAVSEEDAKLSKKAFKEKRKDWQYPSVSYEIAHKIQEQTTAKIVKRLPAFFLLLIASIT